MTRQEFEAKYKYFTIDNFKRTWRQPLHCYSCEKEITTNETYYELHGNTVSSYAKLCKDCYEKLKKSMMRKKKLHCVDNLHENDID